MLSEKKRDRRIGISLAVWAGCLLLLAAGMLTGKRGGAGGGIAQALWLDYERSLQEMFLPVMDCAGDRDYGMEEGFLTLFIPLLSEDVRRAASPESRVESVSTGQERRGEEAQELYALMEREQQESLREQEIFGNEEHGNEEYEIESGAPETDGQNALEEPVQRFLEFTPHEKVRDVTEAEMENYEALLKNFYTIDPSTMAGSNQLNAKKFLEKDLTIEKEAQGPQILIYHTHSQEGFSDTVPGDSATTIVGVGEKLAKILTDDYGYQVLHYTGEYDRETRDDAYSRVLPDLERILEENPTIRVVIDLHRDEMPKGVRLVQDVDGKPTARFMFFNGLSRTKQTGNLDYLYNVYQEDNLAFSFQMQRRAMEYYPGLTRKIYLKGYRYNMHLCPRSLLIELGAQNNTLEEAMNACGPLAHILDLVLSGEP